MKRFVKIFKDGAWKIAVISAVVLILELTFIRLIPAEVKVISYFINLLLMAAFFGLGLGCILQKQRPLSWLLPAGLAAVAGFIYFARGLVIYDEASTVHYWLQYEEVLGQARHLPIFFSAAAAFIFGALPFVALGQALARTMDKYPRLTAYGWDIFGSLAGTILFLASSYFGLPPWAWPAVIAVFWAMIFGRRWIFRAAILAAGFLFLIFSQSGMESRWSPYYFIQWQQEKLGTRVYVNSSFHQLSVDFATDDPDLKSMQKQTMEKFSLPYEIYKNYHEGAAPRRVLILGAGTGNDAVVALQNGAQEITAVEIDPIILELGKKYNTAKPYADKKVKTVVDDARHFIKSADEKYDLIILGTLDSQTLLSGQTNLRLENYVYTREAFLDMKDKLADTGVLGAYYSVFKDKSPWLFGRLFATVKEAFSAQTKIFVFTNSDFLFNTIVIGTKGIAEFSLVKDSSGVIAAGLASTDDWPFLYLEKPTISLLYLKLFGVIGVLIFGVFLLLRQLHPARGLRANFLFLGIGFTLMESAAIVRLALVFGTTWIVNAIVFAAVLAMIFLANFLVKTRINTDINPPATTAVWHVGRGTKLHEHNLRYAWVGLGLSVLANIFFNVGWLFLLPFFLRAVAAGILIGLPVYFAATCFSYLFSREQMTGYALGINLVGAMAGGILEYFSMIFGMRAVWIIVLGVYFLAWGLSRRRIYPG